MTQQTIDTTAQAAVPTNGGLALFDLKVTATPLVITFDVDALNAAVDAVLEPYEGRIVAENEIPGIKSEMAALNKVKEKLEAARKEIAGQISAPVKEFETQVKGIVQRLVDGRGKLDAQVKAFEAQQREDRKASVQTIIDEVLDAAKLDGAGQWRSLWSIVLPMNKPILATLFLITVVTQWNNFLWPSIIAPGKEWNVLTVATSALQTQYSGNWTLVMAATTVSLLPLVLLFLAFHKQIVNSLGISGLK